MMEAALSIRASVEAQGIVMPAAEAPFILMALPTVDSPAR
jgi:hypothetical protein